MKSVVIIFVFAVASTLMGCNRASQIAVGPKPSKILSKDQVSNVRSALSKVAQLSTNQTSKTLEQSASRQVNEQIVKSSKIDINSYEAAKAAFERYQATPFAPKPRVVTCSTNNDPSPSLPQLTSRDFYTQSSLAVVQTARSLGTPQAMNEFVRLQIANEVLFGATRSGAKTLALRSGTAADKANLLVAMLRSTEVPAYFSVGEIYLKDSVMKRLLGAADTSSIFSAMMSLTGSYFGDSAQFYTFINGEPYWTLPHIWVRAYFDGTWQNLDPTQPSDAFFSLQQNSRYTNISTTDWNSFWSKWFFQPDEAGNYIKPMNVMDWFAQHNPPNPYSATDLNFASSVLDEQRIDGVLSNLTPCRTAQAFVMQDSPYEYTATFSLLNSNASASIFTYTAPLAEMTEGLTYLSHSAGLLADLSSAQSGNLEFRVNDTVVESIPTTTGTQYQLVGALNAPPYWGQTLSQQVNFQKAYAAGDVFHFNVFAGQVGPQAISSSMNDILQSVNASTLDGVQCASKACNRFVMARLMRATGILAAYKAELADRDISRIFGVTWVPGGISGTYVSGTGITPGDSTKEFGLSPAYGIMDAEITGLTSIPTASNVFGQDFLNIWGAANNMQLVTVDEAEASAWEELYGVEGLSASRALQWAGQNTTEPDTVYNDGTWNLIPAFTLGSPSYNSTNLFPNFHNNVGGHIPSFGLSHEAAINSYGPGGQFWGFSFDVPFGPVQGAGEYRCNLYACPMIGGFIIFPPSGGTAPSGGGAAYSAAGVNIIYGNAGISDGAPISALTDGEKNSNSVDYQNVSPISVVWDKLKAIVSSGSIARPSRSIQPADSRGDSDGNNNGYANPVDGTDIQAGSPIANVPSGHCSVTAPVNVATGLMWQTFTDLYLRGRTPKTPLKFLRTYYTLSQYQDKSGWVGTGDFGPGWISNYDMRIVSGCVDSSGKLTLVPLQSCSTTSDVAWISEQGNPVLFTHQSSPPGFSPPSSFPAARLVDNGSTFVLRLPGNIIYTFWHDSSSHNGRLQSIREPHGESIQFSYDSNGRLLNASTTLASGNTGTFSFTRNDHNLVSKITASDGKSINLVYAYAYDASNNLISSTDFDGHATTYQYNSGQAGTSAANLLTSITDPIGRIKAFNYYQNGKVFEETDHGGAVTSFQYAPYIQDRYSRVTYPNGFATEYRYDTSFRITQSVYPDGGRAFQSWNSQGRLESQTDQLGRITNYTYDDRGNRTGINKMLDGGSAGNLNFRKMEWDQAFDIPTAIVPLVGNPSNFSLTEMGDIKSVSRSAGSGPVISGNYTYDQFGALLSTNNGYNSYSNLTNSNGQTVFVYDNRNPQTLSYDARGRVSQRQYGNGRIIRYSYDNYDRATLIQDTAGPTIVNKYDAVGRRYETDRVAGGVKQVATFEYNDRDRLIASTNFNGERTEYKYDTVGIDCGTHDAPSEMITPDGKVTRFVYDFAGRVVRKILPGGAQISYEYDVTGQLIAVIDPLGQLTQFEYDANGRLSRSLSQSATSKVQSNGTKISAGLEQTVYSYDASDRLIMKQQLLSNESNFGGAYVTQYTYDGFDRLVTKTINHTQSGKVVQIFDTIHYGYVNTLDQSLLTSVSNTYETLMFSYQMQPPFSMVGFSVTPTAAGAALGLQSNTFRVVPSVSGPVGQLERDGTILIKNGYDAAGRLISSMGALGSTSFSSAISYDAFGRLAKVIDSNGLTGSYGYDNLDRIESVDWSGAGLSLSESLTRNPAGLITKDVREIGTFSYGYTPDNQVSSISYTGTQEISGPWVNGTFTYDSSGNMLSNSAGSFSIYNNFVIGYDGMTYWPDYSGLGRVMGTTQGSNTNSLAFNPDGQLVKLNIFSSGSLSSSADYYYDGLGRRIAKVKTFAADSASKIAYTYYGLVDRVLLAQVSKGTSTSQSLFVDGQGVDQHLFEINSSVGARGFVSDHLGSVINSSAAGGMSVYGLYGKNLGAAVPTNSGAEALTYGFAGREYDPESGYYYNRARYYDSSTGRFLTKDPGGLKSDINPYRYALNKPVDLVDQNGREAVAAVIGGIAGAVSGGISNYTSASQIQGVTNMQIVVTTAMGAIFGGVGGAGAGLSNFLASGAAYSLASAANSAFNQYYFNGTFDIAQTGEAGLLGFALGSVAPTAAAYGISGAYTGGGELLSDLGISATSSLIGGLTSQITPNGIPSQSNGPESWWNTYENSGSVGFSYSSSNGGYFGINLGYHY